MYNIRGNLFEFSTYRDKDGAELGITPDAICITTNGFVKKNGECVMGRGCAKRAAELMPGLPEILGNAINSQGNRVYAHGPYGPTNVQIVTFPVKGVREPCNSIKSNVVKHMRKQFEPGQMVPGWACVAKQEIIRTSAKQLRKITDEMNWQRVVLPRPGCGAGELHWNSVEVILQEELSDGRFYAITF